MFTALSHTIFDFVSGLWNCLEVFPLLARTAALILIVTFLSQIFLFDATLKSFARTTGVTSGSAGYSSEPPENFLMPGDNSFTSYQSLTFFYKEFLDFFSVSTMPEGFEKVKVPTFADNLVAFSASFLFVPKALTATAAILPPGSVRFDFDGDSKADPAIWKSTSTEWKVKNSSSGAVTTSTIGSASSIIAPGDFDGDGKTDMAVFNAGTWTIKKSFTGTTQTVSFGTTGDKPVIGDYDGDGKADVAVFRPSTNTWWILYSSNGSYSSTAFGTAGDIAAQGNYDGDNKTDIAIFRPGAGDWYVLNSSTGAASSFHWGISTDIPVPADFDGDGKTDYAVYRGSSGTWYVSKSSTNNATYITQVWGNYGDQPLPADYDGDGKDDFSVWRPTTGVWHTIKSSNATYDYQTLGIVGDMAVSSAYLKQIGGQVMSYDLAKARLSPKNATGDTNLYSRNFQWGTSLVMLPGRAGLNAGFGISYNSLVWTKDSSSNAVYFNTDNGNVSPGFRFGYSTIEPIYLDKNNGKFSYLMVTPTGARVEFRQIGASNIYETADSSYTQLKTIGAVNPNDPVENITLTVTGTDGTQTSYAWRAGEFRCSQIKDKNGNIITVNHDDQGLLRTVTDTLGRIITVNYDEALYPISVTQTWKTNNGEGSAVTHTYITFTYSTTEPQINTNFSGLTVFGPSNGTVLKFLKKLTYANGSSTEFNYNSYGQVWKVSNVAANSPTHILNYVRTNLETPAANQTDCPRFTETRHYIENFNNGNETVATNSVTENQAYTTPAGSGTATKIEIAMQNDPYGSVTRIYTGSSGWTESLPLVTEDWVNENNILVRKRWAWRNWTQDDINVSYILNPRTTEEKIGDTANIKRTTIDYYPVSSGSTVALYGLIKDIKVYDGNVGTLLKQMTTEYNLSSVYTSRRIIGLPSLSEIRGLNQTNGQFGLVSKVTYSYDEGNFNDSSLEQNISPIQHDNTKYSASLIAGRGNLTTTTRWSVDTSEPVQSVNLSIRYNTAGTAVAQTDPMNRTVKIGYGDSFNDSTTSRNTFAYPTSLTDPANNVSIYKYRFDIGASIRGEMPAPAGNTAGKISTRTFDSIGRLEKEAVIKNNQEYSYTRYEYSNPDNGIQIKTYTTAVDTNNNGIGDAADEVQSEFWMDGAGRTRQSRTENPNSTGGWSGTVVEYDILGRVKRTTVPTEISVANNAWTPSGDDTSRGWLWQEKEYDWKGRITREINTDGTDRLYNFQGCGCAGGQITTVQSELVPRDDQPGINARRTQKIYEDILGRAYKTEILDWVGNVYTSTVQKFNGRDQITETSQYTGTDNVNNTHQTVTMSYDGYGRMKTRHYPIEDALTETSWVYNADDSIQHITDPRGAGTSFTYNSRGLVQEISYTSPANYPPPNSPSYMNIPGTPTVTFSYDAVGNRTQMNDGLGSVVYEYDELSQLKSETRQFSDNLPDAPLSGNRFKIEYGYNLSGSLKFYQDPYGQQIDFTNDKAGRLTKVDGSAFGADPTTHYADNIQYRAWGAVKQLNFKTSDNALVKMQYDARLRVNQHEVDSSAWQGGYVKKAAFSYFADSHPQAMDNQVYSEFDRTFKYDYVGRLSNNQFGETSTPYSQAISYDAFSQMTNRATLYWGDSNSFTSTFTNGREQTQGVTGTIYDASGNQINTGSRSYNLYQTSTYDAANRRVSFTSRNKRRTGRYLYITTVFTTGQDFDGDGHQLKQTRSINNQAEPTQTKYQIWSSVLQSNLTMASYTGKKEKTKVFAGGAVIAEQMLTPSANNTDIEEVAWIHTDPVTGSSQHVNKNGTNWYRTEFEPLGQEVNPYGNEEEFPDPQDTSNTLVAAEEPQWQCQLMYVEELNWSVPTRCGLAALTNLDIWLGATSENNPAQINDTIRDENPQTTFQSHMPADATATNKPQAESVEAGVIPVSLIPNHSGMSQDGCVWRNGKWDCRVEVHASLIDMTLVAGYASVDKYTVSSDADAFKSSVKDFFESYGQKFRRCVWTVFSTDKDGNASNVADVMKTPGSEVFPYGSVNIYKSMSGAEAFHNGNTGDINLKETYNSVNLYDGTYVSAREQFYRTLAHEYANYLSWFYTGDSKTFGTKGGISGDASPGGGLRSINTDDDTGARMEKCIWGNVSY